MDKLCLHKIRPDKSDQAIGPELQNAISPLVQSLVYQNLKFVFEISEFISRDKNLKHNF